MAIADRHTDRQDLLDKKLRNERSFGICISLCEVLPKYAARLRAKKVSTIDEQ